jgi:hypothetical protein
MATTWISFGPDLEPIESELRREARTPSRRVDGLRVKGEPDDVVAKLIEACATSAGWCRFEEIDDEGQSQAVYVNGNLVRVVTPVEPRAGPPS